MIWLSWRQFRTQALVAAGALVALVITLAATRPRLSDAFNSGLAGCTAQGDDCSFFRSDFFRHHQSAFVLVSAVVLFLPALIGLFWGAPLVAREVEAGTHRLAWNQTVTRDRWLAVKLGLGALAAAAVTGLASGMVFWWASPLDSIGGEGLARMTPPIFEARGIVPIGYALFAFALGVAAGTLTRRTLPAMAIALVGFIAVQIAVPILVRPHLIAPERTTVAITTSNVDGFMWSNDEMRVSVNPPDADAWMLSNQTVDASGNAVRNLPADIVAVCEPPRPTDAPAPGSDVKVRVSGPAFKQTCLSTIASRGYRQEFVYQPASRFWPLQWMETGLFVVLAAGLAAVSFRRIRRLS
jgi:hypothetical protein